MLGVYSQGNLCSGVSRASSSAFSAVRSRLFGFCVAEVRSRSAGCVWSKSGCCRHLTFACMLMVFVSGFFGCLFGALWAVNVLMVSVAGVCGCLCGVLMTVPGAGGLASHFRCRGRVVVRVFVVWVPSGPVYSINQYMLMSAPVFLPVLPRPKRMGAQVFLKLQQRDLSLFLHACLCPVGVRVVSRTSMVIRALIGFTFLVLARITQGFPCLAPLCRFPSRAHERSVSCWCPDVLITEACEEVHTSRRFRRGGAHG